jgi:soluble lytic murein transglycosylase-like protein
MGAMGLGQLMPDTAESLGVRDAYDPQQNLEGCVRLLHSHLRRWGDGERGLELVLASYNAGTGAVENYGGVPPYQEVRYVLSLYRELGGQGTGR